MPTPVTQVSPLLIDGRTASRMLGLSLRTVQQLAIDRRIPSIMVGRSRRYSPDSLAAWIRRHEKGDGHDTP